MPTSKGYHEDEAAGSLSPIQQQYFSLYEGTTWRTILGAGYRSLLVNNSDPRVQVGLEVTQRLLELIAERCRNNGVSFHVVLLPTKDNVFWPYIPDPENHKSLRQQVMDEEQLKKRLIFHMRKHGIDFIDLLDRLKTHLYSHISRTPMATRTLRAIRSSPKQLRRICHRESR